MPVMLPKQRLTLPVVPDREAEARRDSPRRDLCLLDGKSSTSPSRMVGNVSGRLASCGNSKPAEYLLTVAHERYAHHSLGNSNQLLVGYHGCAIWRMNFAACIT